MRYCLASIWVSALLGCVANAWSDELDATTLVGKWHYISGMRAGEEVPRERLAGKVTITAETMTVPSGQEEPFIMAYVLHTESTPVGIDLDIQQGPVPEGRALGIIKLEQGKLALCYDPMGQKRPTTFASTEEDGNFLFWLEPQADE